MVIVMSPDPQISLRSRIAGELLLLNEVGQLVGQELLSRRRCRLVLPRRKHDIGTNCVGQCVDRAS